MSEVWEVEPKNEASACRVVNFLSCTQCPFVAKVTLSNLSMNGTHLQLHVAYAPMPESLTLRRYIEEYTLPTHTRVCLASQLVQTIAHMHEYGIFHQFLSSEDILVTFPEGSREAPVLKISNLFGSTSPNNAYIGVRNYRPPEVAVQLGDIDPCKVDCWSVGCLLFEILTGDPLFSLASSKDDNGSFRPVLLSHQLEAIVRVLGTLQEDDVPLSYPPRIRSFLLRVKSESQLISSLQQRCESEVELDDWQLLICSFLQFNPEKRVNATDAKHCRIFANEQEYDWPTLPLPPSSLSDLLTN